MAEVQNTDNTKCGTGCETTGTPIPCWWECKMVQPLWKTVWQFLAKLNILLPYDPAIMLLGIYTNELKALCPHKNYTEMFIATLFVTAKT